jgi:glycosyltransferase involved in cell wall biosynthesis
MLENPSKPRTVEDFKFETPKKGKLRIMPISDSPWAPTGFGTNTKNVSALLTKEGHHIGYGGCQNPQWNDYNIPWPLGQTEKTERIELLPIMHPGQEKFGEKSFKGWIKGFAPQLILTHLDFQMFAHVAQHKKPTQATIPLYGEDGKVLGRKERGEMLTKMYQDITKGVSWKWAGVIPIDGTPPMAHWQAMLDQVDYKICMSRYGQVVIDKYFDNCSENNTYYIPHGVDTNFFKPILTPMYGDKPLKDIVGDAFVIGCVARNQHRKNIPVLIKGFKEFVDRNDLKPTDVRLLLHMDWQDTMGWQIGPFAEMYGVQDYLMPPLMGMLDAGEALDEEAMVHLYNCMDMFVLPTAGEGFGIPTIEAMSCGVPVAVTNYTTAWELIKEDDPETADIPLYPCGGEAGGDEKMNGRDKLLPEDICEAGILLPYKDMWWDTPKRAAPHRAICSSVAIADACDYYYHNKDKRNEAAKAARNKAKKEYSWDVVGERWLEMAKVWEKECI